MPITKNDLQTFGIGKKLVIGDKIKSPATRYSLNTEIQINASSPEAIKKAGIAG